MPETTPASTLEHDEDSEPTMPPPVTVPAYAAGAGTPHSALELLDDAGWDYYTDGNCNVTYRSPDGAVTADFGPESSRYRAGGPLWEVTYTDRNPYATGRVSWRATFGDEVPTEAIAGFLAALTDPAGLEVDR